MMKKILPLLLAAALLLSLAACGEKAAYLYIITIRMGAEVELSAEDEAYAKPGFIGKEVTGDRRYYNSHLRRYPFCLWGKDAEGL